METSADNAPYGISVVIPVYNGGAFIADAIESVLSQGKEVPLEPIVVDDGSTDNTAEVAQSYGEAVRYVWQANARQSAARNHGASLARYRYFMFFDADDALRGGVLRRALEAMEFRDANFIYGGLADYSDLPSSASCLGDAPVELVEDMPRRLVQRESLVPGQAVMRRELFEQTKGFDPKFDPLGMEDWDFFLRAQPFMKQPLRMEETILFKRAHGDSITRRKGQPDFIRERIKFLKGFYGAEFPSIRKQYLGRSVLADWSRSHAFDMLSAGQRYRALAYGWRSLLYTPWQPALMRWLAAQTLRSVQSR